MNTNRKLASMRESATTSQRSTKKKPQGPKPNFFIRVNSGVFKENIEEGGKNMDPYVKVKIGTIELKTEVQKNAGKTPVWNFTADLVIEDMNQDMLIEVWEWDKNSSDDFLASTKLNIQSALGHEGKEFALEVMRKGSSFGYLNVCFREEDTNPDHVFDNPNVQRVHQYLQRNGLERAVRIIFAEILTKGIERHQVYTYAAYRLREIGRDLMEVERYHSQRSNLILNDLSEPEPVSHHSSSTSLPKLQTKEKQLAKDSLVRRQSQPKLPQLK